jgi:hypothetical protein
MTTMNFDEGSKSICALLRVLAAVVRLITDFTESEEKVIICPMFALRMLFNELAKLVDGDGKSTALVVLHCLSELHALSRLDDTIRYDGADNGEYDDGTDQCKDNKDASFALSADHLRFFGIGFVTGGNLELVIFDNPRIIMRFYRSLCFMPFGLGSGPVEPVAFL